MASTFVNDLRLNEMATGDESGNWGVVTNTSLELIGEALGYGTEGITTNADTHTSTIADGATDPVRAMYVEYTGTLDSACTITIAPNTINRMHFIENGTSGSQNIIISQGSGANITIPPGHTKAVYLDGAGSGAAVVDAFASLNVVDLTVEDDLFVTDDLGVGGDIDLEGSIDVNGTSNLDIVDIDGAVDMATTLAVAGNVDFNGDLDVDGTSNLDVVDIDGAVNMATTALVTGVLTTTAATVFNGGFASNAVSTISTADNADTLTLISTDADANSGPNLNLYRNSASPADDDNIGDITFTSMNDAGTSEKWEAYRINAQQSDVSNGTEDAQVRHLLMKAGSELEYIRMNPTGFIFNEASADLDFRVESNGDANMLFVDGGANTVGIGTNAPADLLHVTNGDRAVDTRIRLQSFGQLPLWHTMFAAGTESSPTVATSGTELSRFATSSWDGTDYSQSAAQIRVVASANHGDNSAPSFMAFDTNSTTRLATEKMRLTKDGQLLIGTTASQGVQNLKVQQEGLDSTAGYSTTRNSNDSGGPSFIFMKTRGTAVNADTVVADDDNLGLIAFAGADGTDRNNSGAFITCDVDGTPGSNDMPGRLEFHTTPDGDSTPDLRMTILNGGQVLVGTTTSNNFGVEIGQAKGVQCSAISAGSIGFSTVASGNHSYSGAKFHNSGGTVVGSIAVSNSDTTYNTSSDYRLKENVIALEDGLKRLNQLKPVKFNWKESGKESEGFIAHEVQEVFSDAVTGEKDAVNDEGRIQGQEMDYGRITPLLVKAIQEQQTIIEDLKTRITTLEGA